LPAAKIVGKKGQVFALDKSKSKLRTRKPELRSVFKNQSSNSYLRERKNIQKLLKGISKNKLTKRYSRWYRQEELN